MEDSISRQFAKWAANLTYEDLPPVVVDKVKALILFHLVSGVMGGAGPHTQKMIALIKEEESQPDGATIFGDGAKVTRNGAVFANSEIFHSSGLEDSFRMLTHPGPANVAVALTNSELGGNSMKEVITALAAGYEFECRLSYDFTLTVAARGLHATSVFVTMGAAMVAGKLLGLDEDGLVGAIAIAASCAAGGNESALTNANEASLAYPIAARAGTSAAVLARTGFIVGSELAIEGNAGFYALYSGRNDGILSHVFTGPHRVDLRAIPQGLGQEYKLLEVMFRMYRAPGFNQPIIDLIAELKQKHNFSSDDVEEIVVAMNYFETLFPRTDVAEVDAIDLRHRPAQLFWSIPYHAAHAAVNGGFPVVGGKTFGPTGKDLNNDGRVISFMDRIRIMGVHNHPMFSPEIVVKMNDGSSYFGSYPYARTNWDFDQVVERLQDCVPGIPGGQNRLDSLVETVRQAETLSSVTPLFALAGTP